MKMLRKQVFIDIVLPILVAGIFTLGLLVYTNHFQPHIIPKIDIVVDE